MAQVVNFKYVPPAYRVLFGTSLPHPTNTHTHTHTHAMLCYAPLHQHGPGLAPASTWIDSSSCARLHLSIPPIHHPPNQSINPPTQPPHRQHRGPVVELLPEPLQQPRGRPRQQPRAGAQSVLRRGEAAWLACNGGTRDAGSQGEGREGKGDCIVVVWGGGEETKPNKANFYLGGGRRTVTTKETVCVCVFVMSAWVGMGGGAGGWNARTLKNKPPCCARAFPNAYV